MGQCSFQFPERIPFSLPYNTVSGNLLSWSEKPLCGKKSIIVISDWAIGFQEVCTPRKPLYLTNMQVNSMHATTTLSLDCYSRFHFSSREAIYRFELFPFLFWYRRLILSYNYELFVTPVHSDRNKSPNHKTIIDHNTPMYAMCQGGNWLWPRSSKLVNNNTKKAISPQEMNIIALGLVFKCSKHLHHTSHAIMLTIRVDSK